MTKASPIKQRRKKVFWLVAVLIAAPLIWILIYFASSDPPIAHGHIEYNVPYKEGLLLDVYQPTQQVYEKSPVVLYVHGGAWIAGRKEAVNINRFHGAINALREAGYTIVSPEYTLAGGGRGPFPYCIEDVYDVVTWIRTNAVKYSFDLKNVGIFGESAGAHISMLVAYAEPEVFVTDFRPIPFNYVIDIYGPNQLEGIYHSKTIDTLNSLIEDLPENIRSRVDIVQQIFGFDPAKDVERAQGIIDVYSPYNYVHAQIAPSLLIQGDEDRLVPVEQTISLKAKMDSLGVESKMHILQGVDHAFAGATKAQKDSIQQWVFEFISERYDSNK